jgi:hypothetical protein
METARDIILELYKKDYITRGETDVLLDAITVSKQVQLPYVDWTYRPYEQPSWTYKPYEQPNWTITNNTDTNNVE